MSAVPPSHLVEKYNRPGPRYTSYPTAPEWLDTFGAAQFEERLEKADADAGPLGVYIHLPFCHEMCRFCACNAIATSDRSRADDYLDLLDREVEMVARKLPRRRTVTQLHWGGGTPTFLDESQIERCFDILARRFRFAPDAEMAIEIDPAVTSHRQIELLARLGFGRVSVGVQDFEPVVQEAVGRFQSEADTEDLIRCAREAGFSGVNVDLMYGLPHQTLSSWERTMDKVIVLRPNRLAVFGFAYVPWVKPHQKLLPAQALPGPELRIELFSAAAHMLQGAGYRQIGLDHFALESDELARAQDAGTLTRNFQGYTAHAAADTVAFGMTAISEVAGAYAQCAHRLKDWSEALDAGRLPIERGLVLTGEDVLRRFAINRIMCLFRLDLREVERLFGSEGRLRIEASMGPAKDLAADGLVDFDGDLLGVTPLGRLFVRNVAMMFDAYLPKRVGGEAPVFSRTV